MQTIALPIENKVREFDGKLWLGLNLAERGYEVVLGPSWEIKSILDIIAPDLYFTKDPGDNNSIYNTLQRTGTLICGFSPESGVNSDIEHYLQNRRSSIDVLDAYFSWGPEPAEAVRSLYDDAGILDKIYVTGNPRFDLLVGELNSVYAVAGEGIRDEYGDFILFNTSFGIGNPKDREKLFRLIRKNQPERDILGQERNSLRVLYAMLELVLYLSAEEIDHDIVVRPHPGEDHSTYTDVFEPYDNVHVVHEGDVGSWIYAADGVIHYDCTTGIEAAIMKTPVVSYQPLSDLAKDDVLSQVVSQSITTREGIKEWISDEAASDQEYTLTQHQKSALRRYFPNIDQLAAPQICDTVESLLVESDGFTGWNVSTQQRIERRIKASPVGTNILNLYDYGRDMLNGGGHRKSRAKQRQKFEGLKYEEIAKRSEDIINVASMSAVDIESVRLTKHTYRITKAE